MFERLLTKATVRLSGRSWWQVVYRDGRTISEWDGVDWLDVPRPGIREGRLVCPNGQIAVLGNDQELGDRLYQFKVAHVAMGLGGGRHARGTDAHVMGLVQDIHGNCVQYAWEYRAGEKGQLVGPMQDNLEHYAYGGPATQTLCWDRLRIKPA